MQREGPPGGVLFLSLPHQRPMIAAWFQKFQFKNSRVASPSLNSTSVLGGTAAYVCQAAAANRCQQPRNLNTSPSDFGPNSNVCTFFFLPRRDRICSYGTIISPFDESGSQTQKGSFERVLK